MGDTLFPLRRNSLPSDVCMVMMWWQYSQWENGTVIENGQMNIHGDDNAGVPSPSRADVNPERVEELVFVTLIKHFRGCWSYDEEMEMAVYDWLPM